MMCLEDTWFVAAFHSTPMHDPGLKESNIQLGSACARVSVYYLASSVVVVVGVEDRPPFGDLGYALRHRPTLVLRSHPGVAPWLPHEGFADPRVVQTMGARGVLLNIDLIIGDSARRQTNKEPSAFSLDPRTSPGPAK